MKEIKLHFVDGTKNTFFIIDEMEEEKIKEDKKSEFVKKICNGKIIKKYKKVDGVLFLKKTKQADVFMRIFNNDGTEDTMCANGARCVAVFIKKFKIKNKNQIIINSLFGKIKANKILKKSSSIYLGKPIIKNINKEILIDKRIVKLSAIDTGSPHIIIENEKKLNIKNIINKLQEKNSLLFNEPANINFVKKIDEDTIYVKTYERGVGKTKSCGTGSCASAIDFYLNKKINNKIIKVITDGGELMVKIILKNKQIENIILSGSAIIKKQETVFF